MSEFVEKLAAQGHLSPEAVERIGRNVAAFKRELDENPSFRKEASEKLANAGLMEHIPWKQTAGTLLAAAGIQAAGTVVSDIYRSARDALMKSRNYKAMLDENPDLAQKDARAVQKAFNTLNTFNPNYAGDPSVAGQFVRDSMQLERVPIEQINSIVRARHEISRSQPNGFDVGRLPMSLLTGAMSAPSAAQQEARELGAQQDISEHQRYLENEANRQRQMEMFGQGE